ncbi:TadE/TadG family type IV pilus assembly protein [Marinobacterium stanieri]|uniref:TadE/TadG family type IV pilus assembly protein n=1 Tax=Marinobacterium stanieri TaxID=49186 RepID=UPI000255A85A|nr:TadE/TadG family type IV pilus assembly protein [Marinobacterium stanieri]
MNGSLDQSRKRQRGLAAVEMTIVLPVLLLLMLATAEIGRMLYQYNTLTKAQRDGARLLATNLKYGQQSSLSECPTFGGSLPDNLSLRASNLIVFGNEAGAGNALLQGLTTADVSFCEVAGLNEVRVQVEYDFIPMLFDQLPDVGQGAPIPINFPLTSSISMKVLGG